MMRRPIPATVSRTAGVLLGITLMLAARPVTPNVYAYSGGQCYPTSVSPTRGTVALDPGHGAEDSGARNTVMMNGVEVTLLEKELNLDIANRAKDLLNAKGYDVCLTRVENENSNPTNTERAQYANSVGARVFVLIHLNGSSDPGANYTKTFWGKKSKDLTFSQWMYDALYPALDDVNWDGTRDYVVDGGGVGQFATGALLKSTMPGTLSESVFLTNDAEAERLLDTSTTSRRQQIATVLATGVDTWLASSTTGGGGGKARP